MIFIRKSICKCEKPPFNYENYISTTLGADAKYGEIEIRKCKSCNQNWLHYFIEYEHYSKSGRWYLGKIKDKDLEKTNPTNAIQILEDLDWYFYGGSYFDSLGKVGKGKLNID